MHYTNAIAPDKSKSYEAYAPEKIFCRIISSLLLTQRVFKTVKEMLMSLMCASFCKST